MTTFAYIEVEPQAVLAWLAAGLVAVWVGNWLRKAEGYQLAATVAAGLIGAVAAGLLFSQLYGPRPLLGGVAAAFLGAGLLLAGLRAVTRAA